MPTPSEICARCPKELRGYCTATKPSHKLGSLSSCPKNYWNSSIELNKNNQSDNSIQIVYSDPIDVFNGYEFNPDPIDLSEVGVRDLHYTIYPHREDMTDYHIERLEESVSKFNGIKVCSLLIDDKTIEYKYENTLNKLFDIVNIRPNNPHRREGTSFIESLDYLKTDDPNRVICFGHAKNQQERHPKIEQAVKYWMEALYDRCFNNWEGVLESFKKGYSVTGACKLRSGSRVSKFNWHYSGSFWWVRSKKLFDNPTWTHINRDPYGSESFVGHKFHTDEADCLIYDHKDYNYVDFYSLDWWQKVGLK